MAAFVAGAALGLALIVYLGSHRNLWWPTSVYVLRSHRGRILYIGKSNDVGLRIGQHASDVRKRRWWPDVDLSRTKVFRFSNRVQASIVEAVAIVVLCPRHNIVWNWSRKHRSVA